MVSICFFKQIFSDRRQSSLQHTLRLAPGQAARFEGGHAPATAFLRELPGALARALCHEPFRGEHAWGCRRRSLVAAPACSPLCALAACRGPSRPLCRGARCGLGRLGDAVRTPAVATCPGAESRISRPGDCSRPSGRRDSGVRVVPARSSIGMS